VNFIKTQNVPTKDISKPAGHPTVFSAEEEKNT